jgi:hypothetical protein
MPSRFYYYFLGQINPILSLVSLCLLIGVYAFLLFKLNFSTFSLIIIFFILLLSLYVYFISFILSYVC